MTRRQTQGSETWKGLRDWDRGQSASERLATHLLRFEGYTSVDPSHPLGGPNGLKDVICIRDGVKWIGSTYFPKGQQHFSAILGKLKHDLKGVTKNEAEGIAFVTNQELTLGERGHLTEEAGSTKVDLLHLERISSILDNPVCYGLRLEYLDIEMTKEEQLAFMEAMYQRIEVLRLDRETMLSLINRSETLAKEFRKMSARGSSVEKPKEPYHVTSVNIWDAVSPTREIVYKCSICGFGYFVTGSSDDATRATRITLGFQYPTRAVTCPKCGNVDQI